MTTAKTKFEGKYAKHDVKANKAVNVEFKAPYSELPNCVPALTMLNENTEVAVKIGADKKPLKLGVFLITGVNFGRDGDSTLKLQSQTDSVELDTLNLLVERSDEPLFILLKADIDDEEVDVDDDELDSDEDEDTEDDFDDESENEIDDEDWDV